MSHVEVTSLSSRGQVVIPQSVRDRMKIQVGEKFVVVGDENTIVLKKLEVPSFKGVDSLLKKTRDFAKKKGLKESDLSEAVKQARKT